MDGDRGAEPKEKKGRSLQSVRTDDMLDRVHRAVIFARLTASKVAAALPPNFPKNVFGVRAPPSTRRSWTRD